jgi:hypothetical protein
MMFRVCRHSDGDSNGSNQKQEERCSLLLSNVASGVGCKTKSDLRSYFGKCISVKPRQKCFVGHLLQSFYLPTLVILGDDY